MALPPDILGDLFHFGNPLNGGQKFFRNPFHSVIPVNFTAALLGILVPEGPIYVVDHVKKQGYPIEEHQITTADGYILTYHRIPHGKGANPIVKRPVVLLQHGLIESSAVWIMVPESLGFVLADAGFDVWMANYRGNFYSRKHVSLNPDKDKQFWDFSFHEIGYYDTPAGIDHILGKTKEKQLLYVGMSMGTNVWGVFGTTRPDYLPKIKAATLLAPVIHMRHVPSLVVNLFLKLQEVFKSVLLNYHYEVAPLSSKTMWFENKLCEWSLTREVCALAMEYVAGKHISGAPRIPRLPLSFITRFYPSGTSFKCFEHFRHTINNDFKQYDYGREENLKRYGGLYSPPLYNVSTIWVPMYIHYGRNDWLGVPEDVIFTAKLFPNLKLVREVPSPQFNHFDFNYSKVMKQLVHDAVVKTFKNITSATRPQPNCVWQKSRLPVTPEIKQPALECL